MVIRNYVLTLLYCVIYGELWVQLVELYCLSEPGYADRFEGIIRKCGTIVTVWVGPYLAVVLTHANCVEVSKLAFIYLLYSQYTFRRHNNIFNITYTINTLHVSALMSHHQT